MGGAGYLHFSHCSTVKILNMHQLSHDGAFTTIRVIKFQIPIKFSGWDGWPWKQRNKV